MKQLLKRLALALYPRPRGLGRLGAGSVVMMPRRIGGASRIEIGADTIVQGRGWIGAYEGYLGQAFTPRIRIGDGVRIGRDVIITAIDEVVLGDGCLLSEQVFVSDHTHESEPGPVAPTRQPLASRGKVAIGKHCFIGIRACVLSGVTLGDYCVVGANSVVTRSFPAGSIIGGAPARLIRSRPLPGDAPAAPPATR